MDDATAAGTYFLLFLNTKCCEEKISFIFETLFFGVTEASGGDSSSHHGVQFDPVIAGDKVYSDLICWDGYIYPWGSYLR